jgi:hypothetical protein
MTAPNRYAKSKGSRSGMHPPHPAPAHRQTSTCGVRTVVILLPSRLYCRLRIRTGSCTPRRFRQGGSRAYAPCAITAGREFHPAPKELWYWLSPAYYTASPIHLTMPEVSLRICRTNDRGLRCSPPEAKRYHIETGACGGFNSRLYADSFTKISPEKQKDSPWSALCKHKSRGEYCYNKL